MNYTVKLYLMGAEKINRVISFNDNIKVDLLIKSLVVAMNGRSNAFCSLMEELYILDYDESDLVSALEFNLGDKFTIDYKDRHSCYLVLEIMEKNKGLRDKPVEVISGSGNGIWPGENTLFLISMQDNKKHRENYLKNHKSCAGYFSLKYSLEDNRRRVEEYLLFYEEMHKPKRIEMNITLRSFEKDIKRKIIVNNNILLDKFCRGVVASMGGDLSHLYGISINGSFYNDEILDYSLSYLELDKGNKFSVLYDFGDNWCFNIKVGKISDGYNEKAFSLIDGKGYGIIDDCGGATRLGEIFSKNVRDIDHFDLDKTQKIVDKVIK